jgi:serine/threonine protein kinase
MVSVFGGEGTVELPVLLTKQGGFRIDTFAGCNAPHGTQPPQDNTSRNLAATLSMSPSVEEPTVLTARDIRAAAEQSCLVDVIADSRGAADLGDENAIFINLYASPRGPTSIDSAALDAIGDETAVASETLNDSVHNVTAHADQDGPETNASTTVATTLAIDDPGSTSATTGLVIGIVVVVLLVVAGGMFLLIRKKRFAAENRPTDHPQVNRARMYSNPVFEPDDNAGAVLATTPSTAAGGVYAEPVLLESGPDEGSRLFAQQLDTYASVGGARAAQTMARKMPHVTARSAVTIIERLGGGQFGDVHKAWFKDQSRPKYLVAAQEVKPGAPASETEQLIEEAVLMVQVTEHNNVLAVVGMVMPSDGPGPALLLVSFCENGSLLSFLQSEAAKTTARTTPVWKMGAVLGVAKGMAHLAAHKFVHRDLAARNVLVDSEIQVQIADFGMAREAKMSTRNDAGDDDEHEIYTRVTGGPIPIRWTAPEAWFGDKFNEKSDVWSWSMLMVEVYTDGGKPMAEIRGNTKVRERVLQGYRPDPRPTGCPNSVYKLLVLCWDISPSVRPTFVQLAAQLGRLKSVASAAAPPDESEDYEVIERRPNQVNRRGDSSGAATNEGDPYASVGPQCEYGSVTGDGYEAPQDSSDTLGGSTYGAYDPMATEI